MSDIISTDLILQISFGIIATLSLFTAIAGLHTRDSLAAWWLYRVRYQSQQRSLANEPVLETRLAGDEESSLGMLPVAGLDEITIPSSRISFEDGSLYLDDIEAGVTTVEI